MRAGCVLALVVLAACPAPAPPDGAIICQPRTDACPDGYTCELTRRLCYRFGNLPDLATAPDGGQGCADYCNCIGVSCSQAAGTFASEGECLTACANLASMALSCRVYHCGLASTDPITHCPHALGQNTCP